MPGSTISSFIQFDLIVYRVEDYRNILKLGRKPFAVTSSKAFFKNWRGLELVSLPHFQHDFWRKIFFLCSVNYRNNWPNSIVWLSLLCEILGKKCIVIICYPGCDVKMFFFSTWPKSQDKNLNIFTTKGAFEMK